MSSNSGPKPHTEALRQMAVGVIETEAGAVSALAGRIDENFMNACEAMLACKGRVVVIGVGKSGHIGSKTAATCNCYGKT